jgi:hypothetical protein
MKGQNGERMMATKHDLVDWLYKALRALGGKGSIPELCKYVWENHEEELRASGDLFYTWQYDIRWAAYQLRRSRKMRPIELSPKGIWELA